MASTTFTDLLTVVPAAWLNEVNACVWTVFNGKSTAGTSGTILRSNGTNIVNTTATYPTTTTANQLLYSSATNTIGGLTSANNSVLVTNGSGVPSLATTLPTGLTIPTATLSSATISSLATDLAIADGGTGQSTATAAFDALAPTTTTGDIIYYNGTDNVRLAVGSTGQVLRVSSGAPSWGNDLILGTPQNTTSGTSIDFTGIPSGVKRITLMLNGVSLNASGAFRFQLGDSGGIETSGYVGSCFSINPTASGTAGTSGMDVVNFSSASSVLTGVLVCNLMDSASNTWVTTFSFAVTGTTDFVVGAYSKSTSAVLDRIRMTTVVGTATFDAGNINIMYEF